jgi:alpha-beta hydrolase superfamily lysophospholipase
MGGLIATRDARRHREDLAGVELCSAAVGLGPGVEGARHGLSKAQTIESVASFAERVTTS